MRRTVFIIVGVVCASILGVVGYLFVRSSATAPLRVPNKDASLETKRAVQNEVMWKQAIDQAKTADGDLDGLPDDEEVTLGTNPAQFDSDGDGLSDYTEVRVYDSNPLKSDTRGDGTADGWKVKHRVHPVTGATLP